MRYVLTELISVTLRQKHLLKHVLCTTVKKVEILHNIRISYIQ